MGFFRTRVGETDFFIIFYKKKDEITTGFHFCMECEPEGSSHNSQGLANDTTIDHCSSTTCVILGFGCLRTSKQHTNAARPHPPIYPNGLGIGLESQWEEEGRKKKEEEEQFILFLGLRNFH